MKTEYRCYDKECAGEGPFQSYGGMTTLMGTVIHQDKYGRPLNADENYKTSSYKCHECGNNYFVIDKGWRRRIFSENVPYLGAFKIPTDDPRLLEDIDNTPDYVKEYNENKEHTKNEE